MKRLKPILILLVACFFSSLAYGQHTVTGKVIDETDLEMIGVTIYVKEDPSSGTVTDIDGTYSISLKDSESTLIFSYTGYESKEFPVAAQKVLDVKMDSDVANLDEIVVTGYGVQKKSVVTGAIAKVTSKDLENLPVRRVEESLQARTPGVRVTTDSGQPGSGGQVRIRGTGTIFDSDPLYIVDGVPIEGGLDYLSQSDIESIEVLKDAGSAAIYGARAAYGVVLVTTKTGEKNSLRANYNGYYGVQNAARKLRLLNATEYATLINESLAAGGESILYPDPQSLGQGTDWQDAVFTENAPIQDHQFSVSGGSDKSTVFLSLGLFDQQGIVGGDDSQYRRYNLRMNSRHEINDKIVVGNTIAYTRIKSSGVSTNSEFGSPLGRAVNIDPITPIYETDPDILAAAPYSNQPVVSDENGVFGISPRVTSEIVNPLAALEVQQGFGWSDKVVGSVYAEVEFIEGLKFRTNFGADIANFGGEGFTPVFYLNATNIATQTSYGRSSGRGLLWNWDNTLTYKKDIKGHSLTFLAGITALKNKGNGLGGARANLPVDNIDDASLSFFADIEDQTFTGYEYQNQLASYFGRFYYNYQEKYLFSAIIRRDGSSNFVPTNQFAVFPSFSAGWVVSEENFFGNNPYVNYLKIRGSWGINGNDNINGAAIYSTVAGGRTYTFGSTDALIDGASLNGIANPNLKWEENQQFNIGFDSKIFKKFSFSVDYFIKKTEDMILPVIAPDFTGTGNFTANVGTMENEGVDLELKYGNNFGKLKVNVSGNVSYINNEVTFLAPGLDFLVGQTYSPQALEVSRTVAGNPIGFIFGMKTDGLFQTQEEIDNYVNADGELLQPNAGPGDIKFLDTNQDGLVDNDDRTMIGDPTPNLTYGLTLDLSYGGFNLLMVGQGVGGNQVYNATRRPDLPSSNYTADALERWTGEGTSNYYPRLINGDPNKNFSTSSDFFVEDASFFRIRTLQLAYTLPAGMTDKVGIDKVRVYVSGNNLLTFTKYKGFDPEVVNGVDRGLYPQPRFFLLGLSVGF